MAKYKLLDKIGEGGMGVVYRALQTDLRREVALKLLPEKASEDPLYAKRFSREMEACSQLSHANIIKIFDCGTMDGRLFYAMELIEAQTLGSWMWDTGTVSTRDALNITEKLLDALGYCHERGFIHRDIKPANIMIDGKKHVTLMDFGLVKTTTHTVVTADGRILGTPRYMAPEVFLGNTETPAIDIWAIGAILHELLTGEVLFDHPELNVLVNAVIKDPIPRITDLRPEISPAIVEFWSTCMERNLDRRYKDGRTALEALKLARSASFTPSKILRVGPSSGSISRPGFSISVPSEDPPGLSRLHMLLAAAAGGLLSLVLLFAFRDGKPAPAQVPAAIQPLRVMPAPGGLDVRWESQEPYAGSIRIRSEGQEILTTGEFLSVTSHRALVALPEPPQEVEVVVLDGAGKIVGRDRAIPQPLSEAAMPLLSALTEFNARAQLSDFVAEWGRAGAPAGAGPMNERSRIKDVVTNLDGRYVTQKTTLPQDFSSRWSKRIKDRLGLFKIREEMERFQSLSGSFYSSPGVPVNRKITMMESIEILRDLVEALRVYGINLDLDATRLYAPCFGPSQDRRREPMDATVVLFGDREEADLRREIRPRGLESVQLKNHLSLTFTSFAQLSAHLDKVEELKLFANYPVRRFVYPDPVKLPTGETLKALEIGLQLKHMGPNRELVLELSPDGKQWSDVVIFRGSEDPRVALHWFHVDPRVLAYTPVHVALRIETPVAVNVEDFVKVKYLAFRYLPRDTSPGRH